MIYLGTPGRMIGLKCPASQRVSIPAQPNFKTTLGGRVQAQLPPRSDRRVWDLQTSDATTPDQVAAIMAFASGAWGRGPFWFVSADAPFANLLPPTASISVFGSHADGGPLLLEGGTWAPFSTRPSAGGSGTLSFVASTQDPPVIPGKSVTASAWVLGTGASVMLQFFTAAGTLLSSVSSSAVTTTTEARREGVTAIAPHNAATARVTARNALAAAQAAITWTDSLEKFGDGQGCAKSIVHGASRDLVLTGPGRTYSNLGFTVTEVG